MKISYCVFNITKLRTVFVAVCSNDPLLVIYGLVRLVADLRRSTSCLGRCRHLCVDLSYSMYHSTEELVAHEASRIAQYEQRGKNLKGEPELTVFIQKWNCTVYFQFN